LHVLLLPSCLPFRRRRGRKVADPSSVFCGDEEEGAPHPGGGNALQSSPVPGADPQRRRLKRPERFPKHRVKSGKTLCRSRGGGRSERPGLKRHLRSRRGAGRPSAAEIRRPIKPGGLQVRSTALFPPMPRRAVAANKARRKFPVPLTRVRFPCR